MTVTCPCGQRFTAYPSKARKYCSRTCYTAHGHGWTGQRRRRRSKQLRREWIYMTEDERAARNPHGRRRTGVPGQREKLRALIFCATGSAVV